MLTVFDIVSRWVIVIRGGLARKVSLCYRGLRSTRHDQVSVVHVERVA